MRTASRNTIVLLILYSVCAAGFLVWVERRLNAAMDVLGTDTAELMAKQVEAVLYNSITDNVDSNRRRLLSQLRESVVVAVEKSTVLQDIEIIDESGEVIASDDDEPSEKQMRTTPKKLFAAEKGILIEILQAQGQSARRFLIQVPIREKGELKAYIRMSVEYKPISELYDQIYSYFLFAALAGLLIIIGIGLLIEYQFTNFAKMLARVIDNASEEQEESTNLSDSHELSGIEAAAKRFGTKLRTARTEADLKKYELEKLTRILQVGVILQDRAHKLEFMSDTARQLMSGDDYERVDQDFASIKGDIEALIDDVERDNQQMAYTDLNIENRAFDRRLRFEVHPVESHGWQGYLILVKDSVALDALDDDLRAAARARNLARLYIGAAHDLKTPLNNMVMSLRVLKDKLKALGDDDARSGIQNVENLEGEVSRLTRLLNSLLEQAVPNSAKKEVVELKELVKSLESLVRSQATIQHVTLELLIPDAPINISGFNNQIQQALLNIIINALDAMPRGGTLSIAVEKVGDKAKLSICDSGPGIPKSLLSKVFDMHFTTKDSGTGIGLYVSRVVAEQHGGDLKVKTTLGEGSCFEMVLPLI